MKVDVSRYFEIYDEKSIERMGMSWPIGMSVMPIVAWSFVAFLFYIILGFVPGKYSYKNFHADIFSLSFYILSLFSVFLASYLSYDVYGNYLYYKGIWKNPPFAKSSLKQFWRDIRKGKEPYLLLSEIKGECTVLYFLYTRLFNRGVEVTICNDELNEVGRKWINRLKEDSEQIKEIIFRYEKMGIKEMLIRYRDGREIRLDREKAELLGFLYYLGGTKYSFLANAEDMKKMPIKEEITDKGDERGG
jgi:hypothetical protein